MGKIEKDDFIHTVECDNCTRIGTNYIRRGMEVYILNNGPESSVEYRCGGGCKDCPEVKSLNNKQILPNLAA